MTGFPEANGIPGVQAQILAYLKAHKGKSVSAREIKESLNISLHRVYDSIAYLRSCGYELKADAGGYELGENPDTILAVEVAAGLDCRILGCRIFSYQSLVSTNETAHGFAQAAFPEGTLIIADMQTRGRGRLGRTWHSPPGRGLYFSIILRPKLPPIQTPGISLIAGLAVIRAINNLTGVALKLKWPNDVLYNSRKLAGILVELEAELDRVEYAIVGIGVNVSGKAGEFPRSLAGKAASVEMIYRRPIPRARILQEILREFEKLYVNYCRHGLKFTGPELVANSAVIGKNVTLQFGKKRITGKAIGFDDNGGLIIKSKHGIRAYAAGEVTSRSL